MIQEIAIANIIREIAAERCRQVVSEGWTQKHDDGHTDGSLAQAAGVYALAAGGADATVGRFWPKSWHQRWFKPKSRRRDLIRAAALIVAEIERLDRAAAAASNPSDQRADQETSHGK